MKIRLIVAATIGAMALPASAEVVRVATHAAIYDCFNLQEHLIRRSTLRTFRAAAHQAWVEATAAA